MKSAILIAATIPGNPYPVIENPFLASTKTRNPKGFYGAATVVGFQSHSAIGKEENNPKQNKK